MHTSARYTVDILDVKQRPISVEEFHAMGEAGILTEDDRIELIDGRLIVMEPIGLPHATCVIRLTNLLVGRGPYLVSPQNPLRLSDYTEPLPDIVLIPDDREPEDSLFGPHSLLVIEVSDTTIRYDRGIKLSRYAQAGVPEVWIVDLNKARVEVYRRPAGSGYQERDVLAREHTLTLPGGAEITASEFLPLRPV